MTRAADDGMATDGDPRGARRGRFDARFWLGWIAVAISTLTACFWAFWGINENFHEGWYHESLLANLLLMVGQYLSPMLVFISAALIALRWPRTGGALHALAGLGALYFFRGAAAVVILPFIVLPLVLIGAGYAFGRPAPRRLACRVLLGLPLLVLLICGLEPAWRVATRLNDGDFGARRVTAEGVDLVWAPRGPGWPDEGVTWTEARRRCRHLAADGLRLEDEPRDIWRLPSVGEVVRSLGRAGENAGGSWDPSAGRARYRRQPDKETPLWNPRTQVIYWWTADATDDERALIVVYNGQVHPRRKDWAPAYLGFRAVRSPP